MISLDRNGLFLAFAASAIGTAAMAFVLPVPMIGMVIAALGLVLTLWITIVDCRHYRIPDLAVLGLALLAIAGRIGTPTGNPGAALASIGLDAVLCGGALLAFREIFYRLRGFDGMGLGDVKLGAAAGIMVGLENFAWLIFASSLVGLIIALGLRILRPGLAIDRLPFGAIMTPLAWAFWVYAGFIG